MAKVGRPFTRGQARPPGSGRKPGQKSRPKNLRDRIERRRELREAALDELYRSDPKRALELDSQLHRDDVQLMRYEQEQVPQAARTTDASIDAKARAAGPITDADAMKTYMRMLVDSEDARVTLARLTLFPLDEKPGKPQLAHLPHVRNLCRAVADGQFKVRAEITLPELVKELASAPELQPPQRASDPQGRTTIEDDPQPHAGVPVGGGVYVVPAAPRQLRQPREPYPDPPYTPPPIDAEPAASEPREEADPWDDRRVTIVTGGGFVR